MSVELFNEKNESERVRISLDVALSQFSVVNQTHQLKPADTAPGDNAATQLPMSCDKVVLDAIQRYATLFHESPLHVRAIDNLTPEIRAMLKAAEEGQWLVALYDAAFELGFDTLKDVCAVYFSAKIDEIANAAPSAMEGAKEIRNFLNMRMDWTEDELKHLEEEMRLADHNDPKGY